MSQEVDIHLNPEENTKKGGPSHLIVIPIRGRPVFPGATVPLPVEEGILYEAIKDAWNSKVRKVALFLMRKEDHPVEGLRQEDIYDVGVSADILEIEPLGDKGFNVVVRTESRVKITGPVDSTPGQWLAVPVEYVEDIGDEPTELLRAYERQIQAYIKELIKMGPPLDDLKMLAPRTGLFRYGRLADITAWITSATREELQEVLGMFDVTMRMIRVLRLLKQEIALSQLQARLNKKVEGSVSKAQRDYFLREQLKQIQKELGVAKDDKGTYVDKLRAKLGKLSVPKNVTEVIEEEISRFESLEPHSSEYGVTRNYLDWLGSIPWGAKSPGVKSLAVAKKVLDSDHWGLEDAKKRIAELIATGIKSGELKGGIICLVGPPGVGKTSIGRSVASALDRKFFRFSVGGMRDEGEIKGHRRTYVGAMPGKLIQALKATGTMNPVILIDEIDKMGHSHHGDPASALLEVLDPEQNKTFRDHYLDVECDLSGILFIVTANVLETLPPALLDRMEVIRLPGYMGSEKVEIASRYLIPKHMKEMGLKKTEVSISKAAIFRMIEGYAREAGVRTLEHMIKKLLRKVTLEIVEGEEKKITINPEIIEKYLGKPEFRSEEYYSKMLPGVSVGLAWTSMGGSTLYIETIEKSTEKPLLKLTGQPGEVMKESAQIAWSYVDATHKKYAEKWGVAPQFFEHEVHMHIPAGAIPKDGPSAGITMATSLLSLLYNKAMREKVGMTGELTVGGKVLAIGGLREKLLAAKRAGLKEVICPFANQRDLDEIPAIVKEGLTIHFVENCEEVFNIVFK